MIRFTAEEYLSDLDMDFDIEALLILFLLCAIGGVAVILHVLVTIVYFYHKFSLRVCQNTNSLANKTVVITGATAGIGFQAAKEFAKRGARVILPCRISRKGQRALEKIVRDAENAQIELYKLDVSSLQSVKQFAEKLLAANIKIDMLCLHASRDATKSRKESVDGFELVFATNHLGHFYLTNLLTPLLNKNARVIFTCAMVFNCRTLDFSDMQHERNFEYVKSYESSKLIQVYHMRELAKRLNRDGITVNSHYPGLVGTCGKLEKDLIFNITLLLTNLFIKSPLQGAQTLIHMGTSDEINGVTGKCFQNCREVAKMDKIFKDEQAAKQAWDYSQYLIDQWESKQSSK